MLSFRDTGYQRFSTIMIFLINELNSKDKNLKIGKNMCYFMLLLWKKFWKKKYCLEPLSRPQIFFNIRIWS